MDRDGFISNGELFLVLKMMVGNNLKVCLVSSRMAEIPLIWQQDQQLQQIVDKTIMEADKDGLVSLRTPFECQIERLEFDRDGKLSFEEFALMVTNTVCHVYFYFKAHF